MFSKTPVIVGYGNKNESQLTISKYLFLYYNSLFEFSNHFKR